MSLCPVKINKNIEDKLISTGKILYTGGWDLKKGFHKPMSPFYPAGTVFSENINNTLIKIEEN
jgi:CRISPR-associated protein Cmr3